MTRHEPLTPDPGAVGLAGSEPAELVALVDAAWAEMIRLAGLLDLDAPSRLSGWSSRDVLVHLGSWDEHRRFATLLDDARRGRAHEVDDADARNSLLVSAHHDASVEEIVGALEEARERATSFLASAELDQIGREWTRSSVGSLPVAGVIVASAYELAVHALDVASPEVVRPALLHAGLAALVDVVGALAAQSGLRSTLAVQATEGYWACATAPDAWITMRLGREARAADLGWPAIEGAPADVLDASAGRANAAQLVLSRRLRLREVPRLLELLPALEAAPGLPGGVALRAAARTLAQAGRLVTRLGTLTSRP